MDKPPGQNTKTVLKGKRDGAYAIDHRDYLRRFEAFRNSISSTAGAPGQSGSVPQFIDVHQFA